MYKILHAVIYLIFCIFSLNLFIVRIVFLLHAVIFFACCFTLVCRNKSSTGLMLHVCEYSTKNKISMSMSILQKKWSVKILIFCNNTIRSSKSTNWSETDFAILRQCGQSP